MLIIALYRAVLKFIKYLKKESQEHCTAELVFVCKSLEVTAWHEGFAQENHPALQTGVTFSLHKSQIRTALPCSP